MNTIRNHYGVLIMVITFSSRIIFVGFCWSYGTVLAEFKKQNSTLSDTELSMSTYRSIDLDKKSTSHPRFIQVGSEVLARVSAVYSLR